MPSPLVPAFMAFASPVAGEVRKNAAGAKGGNQTAGFDTNKEKAKMAVAATLQANGASADEIKETLNAMDGGKENGLGIAGLASSLLGGGKDSGVNILGGLAKGLLG